MNSALERWIKLKESPLTDLEISNYYEKNRGKFRHGARIRLGQIFLSRADRVTSTLQEMRQRIQKENPSLSNAQIDERLIEYGKKKEKLAQDSTKSNKRGRRFCYACQSILRGFD